MTRRRWVAEKVLDWRWLASLAAFLFVLTVGAALLGQRQTTQDAKADKARADEQVEALRDRATEAEDRADEQAAEKVAINCVQIGRLNDFTAVVAALIAASPDLTADELALLEPFLQPPPRPAECPSP